jgi:hypothetical protein
MKLMHATACRRLLVQLCCAAVASPLLAVTVTFDDLALAPDSAENGSELTPYGTGTVFGATENRNRFTSGDVDFENRYIPDFVSWSRWAYSNRNDTTTAGFGNDLSAFTASGTVGNFGVSFDATNQLVLGGLAPLLINIANITYPALSMQDGDPFAKKFGGTTGDDADFFLLEIVGLGGGGETGTVPVYLADYRFADNSMDYILDDWVTVDLSSLGAVEALEFRLSSSDNGGFGMNTPAYFAADNIVLVPEPGAGVLGLLAGILLLRRRSRVAAVVLLTVGAAQAGSFAPEAGEAGSTAIAFDDARITGWATGVAALVRGPVDIAFPEGEVPTYGTESDAIGPSTEDYEKVVSLGDGGSITLTFGSAIFDGPGADLAVFENGFDDTYLELAFVEVSSDGMNFFRFVAQSETPQSPQVGSFGRLEPTNVHNLAGKYRVGYGTPFDLAELANTPGLDINAVTHVRVVDVVGTIGAVGSVDGQGRKINDPYPTNFPTGGFDLDAVAVLGPADTTYAAWASERGLNPAESDPDHDGVMNLLEYAIGTDPMVSNPGSSLSLGVQAGQYSFERLPWAVDVRYLVEASADLKTWTVVASGVSGGAVTPVAGFVVEEQAGGAGRIKVTVNGAATYGRLKVTL